MQDACTEEIWREFDGGVRAIIPLFDNEVPALGEVLRYAFTANRQAAAT